MSAATDMTEKSRAEGGRDAAEWVHIPYRQFGFRVSCFWSMENAPEFKMLKDSFLGYDKGMGAWRTQCPALELEVLVLAFPVIALLDRIFLICGFGEGLGNPVRGFFYILRFGAFSMRIVVVVC
jgi:hypothetical protein